MFMLLVEHAKAADTLTEEGIAAFRNGRYSVAAEKLKQAAANHPDDVHAKVFLALTRAARNDCAAALPALRDNLDTNDVALARLDGLAAAKCEEALANGPAALAIFSKLEQQFPKDADVIYSVAKFHMKAFNDATLAMFQRVPSSFRVHQLSAEVFETQDQFDSAVDEYRKAISLNSMAPDLHYRLGRAILMRSHGPDALNQAKAEFEKERDLNPEDSATEFQLGQIAQVENNAIEARNHFERALTLYPDFPESLVALAKLETQSKQYEKAVALLRRAIALQPANEGAHYTLMMVYRDSGQPDKARSEKAALDKLQRPPGGEFTDFLKKLGEKPSPQ
jgi:tetratricopeptide (TPR) repeat protein